MEILSKVQRLRCHENLSFEKCDVKNSSLERPSTNACWGGRAEAVLALVVFTAFATIADRERVASLRKLRVVHERIALLVH